MTLIEQIKSAPTRESIISIVNAKREALGLSWSKLSDSINNYKEISCTSQGISKGFRDGSISDERLMIVIKELQKLENYGSYFAKELNNSGKYNTQLNKLKKVIKSLEERIEKLETKIL